MQNGIRSVGKSWSDRIMLLMSYLFYFFVLLSVPIYAHANLINCTHEEQLKAEEASNTVHDWDSLHRAYHQFGNCDNGGTAEGFSDAVMRLLADKWETAPRLFALISHDKEYKKFILNHINATGGSDDIEKLEKNAQYHCPAQGRDMCKLIIIRARLAIEDMN